MSLYRQEALDAATSRFGAPVRPMGLNGLVLTGFMLLTFVSVLIFLGVGSYSRKETVVGVIQPASGSARVSTFSAGVITQVFVKEGQVVTRGEPILVFSADPSVASGREGVTTMSRLIGEGAEREARALSERASAQVETSASALENIVARRRGLEADEAAIAESLALQKERVRLAQETLDAGRALSERQLFSALQLRQREEALIAARQGVSALERELRQNTAALEQAETEAARVRAQLAQARAEADLGRAQFDQRQAERLAAESTVLVASRPGRVVALQARPGAPVQASRTLAMIVPDQAKMQAELWAPSRAAGFLRNGDAVRLMYDAFPYQKFGVGRGKIISVAGAPTEPADLPVAIETREALYRLVVEIDDESVQGYGRRWPLTPGMRLSADLVLDKRTLWEWLLDPIIAARQRTTD